MNNKAKIPYMTDQSSFFSIEGNIGSGKSTFLRKLNEEKYGSIVYEPHELWQNVGGHNLLDAFYKDIKRWAYSFQTYAFLTRVREFEKAVKEKAEETLFFCERSVLADRFCFGKGCYQSGMMSELEWNMYCQWFDWFVGQHTARPKGIIYLRTQPEIAYQRIQKRSRDEESSVGIDYIEMLHSLHETWLVEKANMPFYSKDIPVLILDCDYDFESNSSRWSDLLRAVKVFTSGSRKENPVVFSAKEAMNRCVL